MMIVFTSKCTLTTKNQNMFSRLQNAFRNFSRPPSSGTPGGGAYATVLTVATSLGLGAYGLYHSVVTGFS